MLEVFGIIALCKLNKKNAIARGKRPGGFIALTIILWVGLEILGAVVSGIVAGVNGTELGYSYIFYAYGFAGVGALISFLCAKFGPRGDYVDPSTQNPQYGEQPVIGTYNVPVNTPAYMMPQQPAQPQEYVHVENPYQPPVQPAVQSPSFCEFCGEPLKPGAKFCASCGSKVETTFE